ncbi:MAG: CvpA family protein [Clostridia bacterium]|nr:CvpA family protein [Clostridia bacterium]MBQ9781447.1 CvpA family protein [Clostridia bacterium]
MNIVFDVILLALFAFMAIRGYFKGFMKMVLSLGRLVLAVIITIIFGSAFSGWIDEKFINPPIFEWVHGKISELAGNAVTNVDEFLEGLPGIFKNFLDSEAFQEKYSGAGASVDALVTDVSTSVSGAMSAVISTVIGYVLLFVLSFVILTIIIWLVGKFTELPLIKTGDKLLGLAVGAVSGLLAVALAASVLYLIVYLTGNLSAYENSIIFKFVKDINVFGFIFDKLLK